MVMGQKWTRGLLFSGKPLDTNMVLCCTEKLCGGTDTASQGAHPLYRLSTASKQKIYQSEKRKVIGQTTLTPDQGDELRTIRAQGVTLTTLMQRYGIGTTAVYRYLGQGGRHATELDEAAEAAVCSSRIREKDMPDVSREGRHCCSYFA